MGSQRVGHDCACTTHSLRREPASCHNQFKGEFKEPHLTEATTDTEKILQIETGLVHPQAIIKCIPPDRVYFGF